MRRVTPADLGRLASQLTNLGALMSADPKCACGCKTKADHAHRVAKNAHGATGSSGGDGRSPKGDHSDPTYAAFMKPNPSDQWLDQLSSASNLAVVVVTSLAEQVHFLGTITSTSPKELSATGSGDCAACGEFCSGAVNDRLRSGFCNPCRMAYRRAGSPDRHVFMRDRRAFLAEAKQHTG